MRTANRSFVVLSWLLSSQSFAATISTNGEDLLPLYYPEEDVVSISTGTYKAIHLAPSVTSVIHADEIKASSARTLDEVLETVAGLHVSKSSARNSSIFSIRGINTDSNPQVLLLVNGLPFNDLLSGSRPPLFRLPVENISRIEVIRGPGSAVFGADAFAGVINVITKDGSEIDGSAIGGRAGSFDTQEGWAQYGGDHAGWDVAVSIEYSSSVGDRGRVVNSDYQTLLDLEFGTAASLAPGPLETGYSMLNSSISLKRDRWSIWFNSWNLDDAGIGPGVAQALDSVGRQENDQYSLVLDYKDGEIAKDWRLDSRLSYRLFDQQVTYQILPPTTVVPIGVDGNICFPPDCAPAGMVNFSDGLWGNPGGKQTETRLKVAGFYEGWRNHLLRLAVGVDRDEIVARETKNFGPGVIDGAVSPIDGTLTDVTGTSNIFLTPRSRTVNYLSLQDEWRLARDWELTAGLRYDRYSDFGNTTNPRLALVWEMDYFLTSKLLYGRAFRAPSMTELFFENNPIVIGNSNLKPEIVDMMELVFDYRPKPRHQFTLSLFSYKADNLIEFVNGVAQNSHAQYGHGFEVETKWYATEKIQLKSNFAFQYSIDADDNSVIANAPRRQLFLAANWRPDLEWLFYGQANWIMNRSRSISDPRPAIADYATVDVSLSYQPANYDWEVSASAKNIFDQDSRDPSDGRIAEDYPLEGRSFYIEARYKLN